jgi:hypothetical protein
VINGKLSKTVKYPLGLHQMTFFCISVPYGIIVSSFRHEAETMTLQVKCPGIRTEIILSVCR